MKDFLLAFVPIFFAVDAIGVLPMFLGLTEGMDPSRRRRVILESVITALAVAIGFIFLGKAVFHLLGVTVDDFMVAGGSLLFIISTLGVVRDAKGDREIIAVGAVPLGTPLLVGPAVLTTSLVLVDVCGTPAVLAAVVLNVALAAVILLGANFMERILGRAGSKAVSKVACLLLASIAVMLMRTGVVHIIAAAKAAH
ncbi:MAG: MarC family protein [Phycisphaerae bacterium]|jgi:multiple antibiotic resistance protein